MPEAAVAATTIGPLQTELREYPLPEVAPDAGWLQVEAAGVCGSDWRAYNCTGPARIMGHENVGRICQLGRIGAARWGLREGDRVALEEYLPCGHCHLCRSGEFRLCEQTEARLPGALRYGTTPVSEPPALWGGYSQYQYLHPNSVFHCIAEDMPAELAVLCIPIGNGFQWMYLDGSTGPGKSVLIQGPGQQGLACVVAAKSAGADVVMVSGLAGDEDRLQVAQALGADYTINIEREDLDERVQRLTHGAGVDLCIDTAGAPGTLTHAIRAARKNGLVLLAAAGEGPPEVRPNDLLARRLTLRPCRGHSYAAVELALRCIASNRFALHLMATHRFGLRDVDLALRSTGGCGAPGAIHVTVLPWS
jgi:threonine dehydrogenase-like Zn-dependent dehydrogenase